MSLHASDLIRARLQGIKTTLERTPPKEKGSHVALALNAQFNEILQEVEKAYPDLAPSLPKQVRATGPFIRLGKAPLTYIDLEIFAEQVLNLIALVKD